MKTKILVFAALLIGGLILTSCSKDNALIEDNAFAQTAKDQYDEYPDPYWVDMLSNYPDPFNFSTTIEFKLNRPCLVTLSVYKEGSNVETVILEGLKTKGTHSVVFSGKGLEDGKYFAELRIGDKVAIEEMTKVSDIAQDDGSVDY